MSAFEKLKALKGKGTKHKYDVDELENVYETVDEKEYTERVLQRQEDDWIDDDGMSGSHFFICLILGTVINYLFCFSSVVLVVLQV